MSGDDLYDRLVEARKDYQRARLLTEAADDNLDYARWAYVEGLVAELGCGLLVETVWGFVICEGAAVSAAVSGAEWMASAETALELAREAEEKARQAAAAAREAWCARLGEEDEA